MFTLTSGATRGGEEKGRPGQAGLGLRGKAARGTATAPTEGRHHHPSRLIRNGGHYV